MGLLGLLEFSLKCFDVLAWPLVALVYPLYSSIRAIETNSITDTHKLNTYWIVFSWILLFEHAFMKLLEWFPLWLHIRLLIVFWLVIPHFDGAFYVYKHLICPCLSMDLQNVITWFKNWKESFMRENFLSEVERYVKDNGPEALEKIVTGKSTESNLDVKEFNVISSMDDKAVECSTSIKPNGGQKDIKVVHVMAKKKETTASQGNQVEPNLTGTEDRFSAMKINEKPVEVAADTEILETPPPKKVQIGEWTCTIPTLTDTTFNSPLGVSKHKAVYEELKLKNQTEPKLTHTESSTFAATRETKEKPIEVAMGREDLEFPPEKVQKEWTCALCQVTTTCKKSLNSHLKGRKHKAAYDALKARNQAFLSNLNGKKHRKNVQQENPNNVARDKRGRNHWGRLSPDIGEPVTGWNGWYPAPAPEPVALWQDGWYSAPAPPVAAPILEGGAPVLPSGWAPDPAAVWQVGWDSAPAPPFTARILQGGAPVFPSGWALEPVAVSQDGWDSDPAPAPAVAAPMLEGGAPVFASGWD